METAKRKVTAKLSAQNVNGQDTGKPSFPSISYSPQVVVRAKISSTARARTSSNAHGSNDANGSASLAFNGALRPQTGATVRRSPSPAKMRPGSPSKLQPQLRPATVRASLSKASTMMPPTDRTRHGSISSALSLTSADAPGSTTSAPTTPLPRRDTNRIPNGDVSSMNVDTGSGSFRVKSKVSGLARPAPPSLSTILSPPSPQSASLATPPFPTTNRPPRTRATTVASRGPSVSLSAHQSHSSQPGSPPSSHEQPQLVPLPASPPASAVSFSSHSSTSASSAHSHSTSTGLSLSPFPNHVRSESLPMSALSRPSSSYADRPASPPPKRTLVARVRPGTRVSGGRGRGWTSGSSVAGDLELASRNQSTELDDRSTDGSDSGGGDEARRRGLQSTAEDDPEDDVRAEAKSNRKIADLEITTRSLLTINTALEASKLRQAREIRDLRRKLRETRLAMPPGRFRLLTEQERSEDGNGDREEGSSEDEEEAGEGNEDDESFKRLKMLLEDLLDAGRNALAVPAPSTLLSPPQDIPSPSSPSGSGSNLGLGTETLYVTGTRMDQGEVLGWDVGSGLGIQTSSSIGVETGSRRWKHGVAIGSKVLSPEEAKLWSGEGDKEEVEEQSRVETNTTERGDEPDRAGSPAPDEDTNDSYGDIEPDIGANALNSRMLLAPTSR